MQLYCLERQINCASYIGLSLVTEVHQGIVHVETGDHFTSNSLLKIEFKLGLPWSLGHNDFCDIENADRIVLYCPLEGIVHLRIKICWKSTYPQAIQNVHEFVSSSEQIWRNLA